MPYKISRKAYAVMFGPTTGDKVRLADTELFIEIEKDFTTYGEEVKFGGGKVIRDGMGQSQVTRAGGAVDTVITNAVIIDHTGIYKADIGLKDGRIAAIGKAGNPDMQPGVNIIVGPGTEAIAGEGKIITAGGMDSHINFIAPQQIEEALMSGLTTRCRRGRTTWARRSSSRPRLRMFSRQSAVRPSIFNRSCRRSSTPLCVWRGRTWAQSRCARAIPCGSWRVPGRTRGFTPTNETIHIGWDEGHSRGARPCKG